MKVVIVAGGTGGHFYPGLAVAKALIREGNDVSFLVRTHDYVVPLLEREGIPFTTIVGAGLKRSLSLSNLLLPFTLALGFLQSLFYFFHRRPSLVLVMGGYLSVPPAVAAKLMMVPVVLHEQNIKPGLANRMLSWLASKVAVSFQESAAYFKGLAVVTGNPIRAEFGSLPAREESIQAWGFDSKKKTLLVFGGSLGSRPLNTLVLEALSKMEDFSDRYQILHVTGRDDEARIKEAYAKTRFLNRVVGYCHDMPHAYGASDLVLSRAGASTVAELVAVKKPAFLVPYPFATANHQLQNAQVLADAGAATVVEEKQLHNGELRNHLRRLMTDGGLLDRMSSNYQRLNEDPHQAVGKIVSVLQSAVKGPLVNCWFV